jgi:stage IV sporulation protein FB
MPPLVQIPTPIRLDKMTRVMKLRGVDVYVHWTVFAIGALMIYAAIRQPWVTLAVGMSWLALMLLHESGHMVAAQRKSCGVESIELYPIFGLCRFQAPWSRFDHCVIAWGGVIAQMIVAIPVVMALSAFGVSRFEPINAILFVLGPYSVLLAIFNLLPIGRFDGAVAWRIVPEIINRFRAAKKREKNPNSWRSY